MQSADYVVHDDAGSMLLFVVSFNVDDAPWAWYGGRHPNVASDMFGVSELFSMNMVPCIAAI